MWYEPLLEKKLIPDFLIRAAIRRRLADKLAKESAGGSEAQAGRLSHLLDAMRKGPIALHTREANEQHYELPPAFFRAVLGKHLKYSCGYWPEGTGSLDDAEAAMLELYCGRAQIENGHRILELGCGWGSLSLYLAEKYPEASVTGVSNSASQKKFIDEEAAQRGLSNLEVVTADMNHFEATGHFDRVVSIEMFEHMRNYELLLSRIASWLNPGGLLFVHIFSHRVLAYAFDAAEPGNWMARYFFTGGLMPSHSLLFNFQKDLCLRSRWAVDGKHYQKTCEAWLDKMDGAKKEILPLFEKTYGPGQALKWWCYWRVFFMSCAELFGYRDGAEWFVSHYVFERQPVHSSRQAV